MTRPLLLACYAVVVAPQSVASWQQPSSNSRWMIAHASPSLMAERSRKVNSDNTRNFHTSETPSNGQRTRKTLVPATHDVAIFHDRDYREPLIVDPSITASKNAIVTLPPVDPIPGDDDVTDQTVPPDPIMDVDIDKQSSSLPCDNAVEDVSQQSMITGQDIQELDLREMVDKMDLLLADIARQEPPQQQQQTEKQKDEINGLENSANNNENTSQSQPRTRLLVAQELEAALQFHLKMGDEISKSILDELAAEYLALTMGQDDEQALQVPNVVPCDNASVTPTVASSDPSTGILANSRNSNDPVDSVDLQIKAAKNAAHDISTNEVNPKTTLPWDPSTPSLPVAEGRFIVNNEQSKEKKMDQFTPKNRDNNSIYFVNTAQGMEGIASTIIASTKSKKKHNEASPTRPSKPITPLSHETSLAKKKARREQSTPQKKGSNSIDSVNSAQGIASTIVASTKSKKTNNEATPIHPSKPLAPPSHEPSRARQKEIQLDLQDESQQTKPSAAVTPDRRPPLEIVGEQQRQPVFNQYKHKYRDY